MKQYKTPCDNNDKWVYNLHNRTVVRGTLRLDRCSALVVRECNDMGAHLHERHCLPEGYLLAESTPPNSTGFSETNRILWADSEKENNTRVGVQNLGTRTTTRTFILWFSRPIELGERLFIRDKDEEDWLVSDKVAEFLMEYPRIEHARILKAEMNNLMIEWLDGCKSKGMGDYDFRTIIRKTASNLAARSYPPYPNAETTETAIKLFRLSVEGTENQLYSMIREAVEVSDTISDTNSGLQHDIAMEVEKNWGEYGITEYFKGSKENRSTFLFSKSNNSL